MDLALIKTQLAAGSEAAYQQLFKTLFRDLCGYAYHIIPDIDSAKDIVQDVFVSLWVNRSEAEKIGALKAYLYRCVYHACIKKLEHQKVRQRYYSESEYQLKMIQFEDFESSYEESPLGDVYAAIEQLPEKNREVFKLRFIDGLNTKQVSEQLDITPRTVETHISKALKFLRENLSVSNFSLLFFMFSSTCFIGHGGLNF